MKNWRLWLGIVISLVFIGLALSQVKDWHRFYQSLIEANYLWVFPAILSFFLILIVRATRWQYIINSLGTMTPATSDDKNFPQPQTPNPKPQTPPRAGWWRTFVAINICYMGNNIFPFRAGEIIRVWVLSRRENIPMSPLLATVVVERLFDFLTMLILMVVLLLTFTFPEQYKWMEGYIHKGGITTIFAVVVLLVCLYLLFAFTGPMMKVVDIFLKLLPVHWAEKLRALILSFADGLSILGRPRRLFVVQGLSIVVWLVNLLPIWLIGQSFGIHVSFMGTLFLLFLGAAGAAVPVAPGFFGTFHYVTQQGLVFLGLLDQEQALSFAIILHASYYFPIIIAGAIMAWFEGYSIQELRSEAQKEEISHNQVEETDSSN